MKNMKEKLGAKLKKKNGFTLIEMLVVVAIIVILVLVSIPMVNNSLEKAREATDEANLRAAKAVAVIEYLNDMKAVSGYYDADEGKIVNDKNSIKTKYGQSKDNKGQVISVVVTEDGAVTCKFETSTETPVTPAP